MTTQQFYTDKATGKKWPLVEAEVDYTFQVYKSDRRKAVIGDPTCCLIAEGLKHNKDVVAAHIGSGKDAVVVFKGRGRLGEHAKHYVLLAKAERVRDIFDGKGAPKTQYITLSAPTAGRTLAARKAMNRKRQAEIKAGTRDVKRRDAPRKTRMMRLGVSARPRAVVSNGVWTIPDKEEGAEA